MGLFCAFADFLKGPVGNGLTNDPADVKNTKRNLSALGFFNDETENGFLTRELDTGIRNSQRDNALQIALDEERAWKKYEEIKKRNDEKMEALNKKIRELGNKVRELQKEIEAVTARYREAGCGKRK